MGKRQLYHSKTNVNGLKDNLGNEMKLIYYTGVVSLSLICGSVLLNSQRINVVHADSVTSAHQVNSNQNTQSAEPSNNDTSSSLATKDVSSSSYATSSTTSTDSINSGSLNSLSSSVSPNVSSSSVKSSADSSTSSSAIESSVSSNVSSSSVKSSVSSSVSSAIESSANSNISSSSSISSDISSASSLLSEKLISKNANLNQQNNNGLIQYNDSVKTVNSYSANDGTGIKNIDDFDYGLSRGEANYLDLSQTPEWAKKMDPMAAAWVDTIEQYIKNNNSIIIPQENIDNSKKLFDDYINKYNLSSNYSNYEEANYLSNNNYSIQGMVNNPLIIDDTGLKDVAPIANYSSNYSPTDRLQLYKIIVQNNFGNAGVTGGDNATADNENDPLYFNFQSLEPYAGHYEAPIYQVVFKDLDNKVGTYNTSDIDNANENGMHDGSGETKEVTVGFPLDYMIFLHPQLYDEKGNVISNDLTNNTPGVNDNPSPAPKKPAVVPSYNDEDFYAPSSSSTPVFYTNNIVNANSTTNITTVPAPVVNDRKMYNNMTQLVKTGDQIQIFIEPKYAANDANGSLGDQYVVFRQDNGQVSHTQEITLDQYNSMLIASGKATFTQDEINQMYLKRQHIQGVMKDNVNKTTFDAKVTKNGNDILLDTTGDNNGFNQPTDKQMVVDTDDKRVLIHRTNAKNKHRTNKLKANKHSKFHKSQWNKFHKRGFKQL